MRKRANTRATVMLVKQGFEFSVHEYSIGESEEATYGEAVAAEVGVSPDRLFKTLVATVDDLPTVAIVPVSGRLSLKALARAAGGKKAQMADPADAERWTGYVTGGISPFGQTKRMPVFVDESVTGHRTIFASGGRRGLQIEVQPTDLVSLLDASVVGLVEE